MVTTTQTRITTYFAIQIAVREGTAVKVARIMPWRYSWPQPRTPMIAITNATMYGGAAAAACVTTMDPRNEMSNPGLAEVGVASENPQAISVEMPVRQPGRRWLSQ